MRIMIVISVLLICTHAFSQTNGKAYAEIGKPCPDFTLRLNHFDKKVSSVKKLQGQNIIFDFFSKGCTACFASLPKINNMQKKFLGKVQFISIGNEEKGIQPQYEKFRAADKIIFPVDYSNEMFNYFIDEGVPILVCVDKRGVIKAITSQLDSEQISNFILGKNFTFFDKSHAADLTRKKYDRFKAFLVNGNGGNDSGYLYRSLLSQWNPSLPYIRFDINNGFMLDHFPGRYDIIGCLKSFLYKIAYLRQPAIAFDDSIYGVWSSDIILETKDSASFNTYNTATGDGIYCYSLTMPPDKATTEKMRAVLKNDLSNYFGYVVNIETRKMPCWKLIASDSAARLLKTAGGEPFYKVSRIAMEMKNQTIKRLLGTIWSINTAILPLIDSTGLECNIDFKGEGAFMNIPDLRRALNIYGLDLVLWEKEMKVIVLKDNP